MRSPLSFSSRCCSSSPSGASAYGARLATLHSTLPTRENRGSCAWIASSSPLLRPSAQMGGVVARVAAPVWYRAGPETLRQQPLSPCGRRVRLLRVHVRTDVFAENRPGTLGVTAIDEK